MHLVNNLNSFKMRKSSLAKGWIYLSGNFFTSKTLHKSLQHNNIHTLRCFRYFKDTKLKANHNNKMSDSKTYVMFPIFQRY